MKNVKVLDVTLRDGGCVNNFNFGQVYMEKILQAQELSHVDLIEMGYIDSRDGSVSGRTKYKNEKVISESIMKQKMRGTSYVAMIDYGKFEVGNLQERVESGIDGIRLAFHKENMLDMIHEAQIILEKGYDLYIQPMITLRYTDVELLELIDLVNKELSEASAFYIVDSFGEMRPNDMGRMMNLVDHNLIISIPLGFHSHNNLQMSYSNAVSLLQFPTNRELMIDSSIMGMGKGAGNLNTELLLEHLNIFYGKEYDISPLLDVMDNVLNPIRSEYYWGYSPEYYLSSVNHCTPSYASFFYNKHMLPIDRVGELLGMIDDDKKISFDSNYAEQLYVLYNSRGVADDSKAVRYIFDFLDNKNLLLIAPGKSIANYRSEIVNIAMQPGTVTFGLNLLEDFGQEYVIVTRKTIYKDVRKLGKKTITLSNIVDLQDDDTSVLDYKKWTEVTDGKIHDSSSIVAFKLAEMAKVGKVYLAGFDGFSVGINENYYEPEMRVQVLENQVGERNRFYKNRIKKMMDKGMEIVFVTPSKYKDLE